MPLYDFKHSETGEIWQDSMPYAEKAAYMEEHNCTSIILKMPSFVSGVKDVWSQTDEGFKERMKGIKSTGGRETTIE